MSLEDDVRNLARNPTLRGLEPQALRLLAFSAETRILRAGDVLFRRGEPSDGGYVVLSGSVALESGGATMIARPPSLLGDTALIVETRRPATASAREPSGVLKISRVLFHRVLGEYPHSAARIRQTLAKRLLDLDGELGAVRNLLED